MAERDSEYTDRTFSLTPEQMEKFQKWQEEKGEVYVGAVGGAYTFLFHTNRYRCN